MMTTTTRAEIWGITISQRDREALQACMDFAMRELDREAQLKDMLVDRPWEDVAWFAAFCVQTHTLSLMPWEEPPCSCDADAIDERDKAGQRLLRKMLKVGLSRFEPDPIAALKKHERKRA